MSVLGDASSLYGDANDVLNDTRSRIVLSTISDVFIIRTQIPFVPIWGTSPFLLRCFSFRLPLKAKTLEDRASAPFFFTFSSKTVSRTDLPPSRGRNFPFALLLGCCDHDPHKLCFPRGICGGCRRFRPSFISHEIAQPPTTTQNVVLTQCFVLEPPRSGLSRS